MLGIVFTRNGRPLLHRKIETGTLTIGRDHNNDIQLTDEDISRQHCKIEWRDFGPILTDLSSNGTYLNKEPVKSSKLKAGDIINIGGWTLEIKDFEEEPQKPTVSTQHQPTLILNFDADKKKISTRRVTVKASPPDKPSFKKTFTNTEITFGTLESCDIKLDDSFISRQHCRLIYKDNRLFLMDLGSTNGTFIDDNRVEKISVPEKGKFQIGKTQIEYSLEQISEDLKAADREELGPMIGKSKTMREIFSLIEKVAPSDATTLVTGESGTGKDLVSRLLHQFSHRSIKPFISINCGSLPASIIESQLFGHEKGSFTGATERMIGLFEQANGGTLFLDEIGEMPLELQTRLLHVLESKKIRRLGGREDIDVDFRLIAATNKELQKLVAENKFRQDLFYRLYVVPIHIKPLRERTEDIPPLSKRFLKDLSGSTRPEITKEAMEKLQGHNWPGNIRELKNVIQRSIIISEDKTIGAENIIFAPVESAIAVEDILESKERDAIIRSLRENNGNQTKTAKQLGIARTTLASKISRYKIDPDKV